MSRLERAYAVLWSLTEGRVVAYAYAVTWWREPTGLHVMFYGDQNLVEALEAAIDVVLASPTCF